MPLAPQHRTLNLTFHGSLSVVLTQSSMYYIVRHRFGPSSNAEATPLRSYESKDNDAMLDVLGHRLFHEYHCNNDGGIFVAVDAAKVSYPSD